MRKYAVGKAALALALTFGMVPAQAFADVTVNIDEDALFRVEGNAVVASGTCGTGVTWTLYSNGLIDIQGSGSMEDFRTAAAVPWHSLRSQVKSVNVARGVSTISPNAFAGCTSLVAIKTPVTLVTIGESAFSGCTSLVSVEINEGLEALGSNSFAGCTSLGSVRIPTTIMSIGKLAFAGCDSLEKFEAGTGHATYRTETGREIISPENELVAYANASGGNYTVPNSVTAIGEGAFRGCSSLESVEISEGVKAIGNNAFNGCTSLARATAPATLIEIGSSAFSGCSALAHFDIPGAVTTLGSFAFANCAALDAIVLPASVESIGENAFFECKSLASVEIGKGVTQVGSSAFCGCEALAAFTVADGNKEFHTVNGRELVTSKNELVAYANASGENYAIPNSIAAVGNEAFSGCTSLNLVNIPDSVRSIGAASFYGCTALTSVEIPRSVISVGPAAFYGCTALSSAKVANGVVSIGNDAFRDCTDLGSIDLPSSVGSVGNSAFSGCTKLASAKFADGATFIGSEAFADCTALAKVELPASLSDLGNSAFAGCISLARFDTNGSNPSFYTVTGRELISPDSELIAYANASGAAYSTPSSVRSIANGAFAGCASLGAIEVTEGVKSVGNDALSGCTSLTIAKLASGVETIGNNAFRGCTSLSTVELPSTVGSLGSAVFYGCPSLSRFSVSGGNSSFRTATGRELISSKNELVAYANASGSSYTIPSQVTTIGNNAFSGCANLTSVGIPTSVTVLGSSAFWGCTGLASVSIPGSVSIVSNNAFYGCTSLSSLTFGDGVKALGNNAFRNCTSLTTVTFPSTLGMIGPAAFYGCTSLGEVSFRGDKPAIAENSFGADSLTANILLCRKGWGDAPLGGFGGDIAWNGRHEWGAWSTASGATCDGDGTEQRKCAVCGATEVRYTPANGHVVEWVPGYPATCETPGLSDGGTCSVCGAVVAYQEPTPALGHDYIGAITKMPNCTETGVIVYTCSRDASHSYAEPISATGHSWSAWTRIAVGVEQRTCGGCGAAEERDCSGAELFVTRLYNEVFDREPDSAGLQDQVNALMENAPACNTVVSFFSSPEFTGKGYDNATMVAIGYRAILGREASAGEIDTWVNMMVSQGMSSGDLAYNMCCSKEFNDLCDEYGLNSGTR